MSKDRNKREEERQQKMDSAKENAIRISQRYKNVFSTPDGKEVLEDLELLFDPPEVVAATEHATIIKAAQRDVMRYIQSCIRVGEKYVDENS